MVLDGILTAIKAVKNDNFDPEKSQNPFAYFTQIIWWAFLRRINLEDKEKYIRYKKMNHKVTMEMEALEAEGIKVENLMPDDIHEFMEHYEKKQRETAAKIKSSKKIKKKSTATLSRSLLEQLSE